VTKIFGDFIEMKDSGQEYLKIDFSPTSIPLQQRWRNKDLSADFIAHYLSTFFSGEDGSSLKKQAEIKNSSNYMANELLENALKFSYAPSQYAISVQMYLEEDKITFYATNSVDPKTVEDFQTFIQRLLTENTHELYMEQLTRNTEDDPNNGSGLGFLTMINDYGVKLAWKFKPLKQNSTVMTVTTMAQWMV
jgi:hypothetical protein